MLGWADLGLGAGLEGSLRELPKEIPESSASVAESVESLMMCDRWLKLPVEQQALAGGSAVPHHSCAGSCMLAAAVHSGTACCTSAGVVTSDT